MDGQREAAKRRAVNPMAGSYRLLNVLARLGVAGVEPLAHMLGISSRAVYSHARRLEHAGLARRVPIRDGGGGAIAISRTGAARVRDDGLPAVAPKEPAAKHRRAFTRRLLGRAANLEPSEAFEWLEPAELRADRTWRLVRNDGAGHLPDLGLTGSDGARVAIEVELHRRRPTACGRFSPRTGRRSVWAGSTPCTTSRPRAAVARSVQREADRAMLGSKLDTIELDEVIRIVRARRAKRKAHGGGGA